MDRRWLEIGSICLLTCASLVARAEAAVTGPINVTAIPGGPPGFCASAIPNDGMDDQPAIQCAINNILPASGGELYFPAGYYFLHAPLTIQNKSVMILGAGQRISRLLWRGDNAGIQFTSNGVPFNHTLGVKSLSLNRFTGTPAGPNGAGGTAGSAISASWPTPTWQGSYGGVSATIFDVYIDSVDPETFNWTNGISLTNAVGARISGFNIFGKYFGGGNAAIEIAGKSIGVSINDGDMGRFVHGILVTGQSEAVVVENIEGSEHYRAFKFSTTGKGHVVAHCHASVAFEDVVLVEDSADVAITDNVFFLNGFGEPNPNPFTAIRIRNLNVAGSGFRVRGNQVIYFSGAHPDGIVLEGTISDSVISGNVTYGLLHGIWLKPGVNNSILFGNRNSASPNPILDQGTSNVVPLADNPM